MSFANHPLGLPETYAERLAQRHSDVGFILAQLDREFGPHGVTRNQVAAMRKQAAPRVDPKMLAHVTSKHIRERDFEEFKGAIKSSDTFLEKLRAAKGILSEPVEVQKAARRKPCYVAPSAEPLPVGYRAIIASIASDMDVTYADVIGTRRYTPIMRARLVAYMVLTGRGNSLAQAGRWIGGRDHSTVINGIKKFERDATPWMRELVARWTKQETAA